MLSASPSIASSEDLENGSEAVSSPRLDSAKPVKPTKRALHSPSASRSPSPDDDVGGWGTSKRDYYDADVIETEADALEEEAEARRLQQKQLAGMTEADFGFDEAEWLDTGKGDVEDPDGTGERGSRVVKEVLPQLEISDEMGEEERLQILRTRYPEFEPLAKEFVALQQQEGDLSLKAEAAMETQKHDLNSPAVTDPGSAKPPMAAIKHSALRAYLAALCMYFAIFTSGSLDSRGKITAISPTVLREHPIMDSLMQCRELWNKVKGIPEPELSARGEHSPSPQNHMNGHHYLPEADIHEPPSPILTKKPRKRKSRAERAQAAAQAEAEARRAERLKATEASLASLSSLTNPTNPTVKSTSNLPIVAGGDDTDFGDPTSLPAHEAAQKAARKKSLKFYTSQIASKAQKRGNAGRDAGGDMDVPRKERVRDRQERLTAMAEKRGAKAVERGQELDGSSGGEEDVAAARAVRGEEGGGDDDAYYELVASRAARRKEEKAARAAAVVAAAEGEGRDDDEGAEGEMVGKRAISRAIEKNKGLQPKRKKEVRNPRVKKRKKFEEKKKRLGSIRPVYKGGEGKGYEGEKTGIKGGLVRSVKL